MPGQARQPGIVARDMQHRALLGAQRARGAPQDQRVIALRDTMDVDPAPLLVPGAAHDVLLKRAALR